MSSSWLMRHQTAHITLALGVQFRRSLSTQLHQARFPAQLEQDLHGEPTATVSYCAERDISLFPGICECTQGRSLSFEMRSSGPVARTLFLVLGDEAKKIDFAGCKNDSLPKHSMLTLLPSFETITSICERIRLTSRPSGSPSKMKRFLTLAAVAIAPLDVTAWGVDNDAADALARWDYWPPLPSRPHFARYLSSRPGGIHLKPQSFESVNLFELGDATKLTNKLLYGSVLLRPTLLDADAAESDVGARRAFEFAVQKIKSTGDVSISPDAKLIKAVVLPLSVTGDNGASEMVVVHHHTTTKRDVMEFKSHVELGINFYLTIEDVKFNRRHHVVVGLDREGAHNVFQHTHSPLNHADQPSCAVTDGQCDGLTKRPRILSYNVWNTNPSGDVYGPMRRWDQYVNRLEHLVRFVKEARADIIGFQEVRYDGVFGGRGEHAQIQHLTSRLPGYQYTYQAAMSYLNDRSPFERIEEGPAVFSKYPIIETDYLLLSRDPNDPNDSHQRLCLHAVVSHPTWGNIDIYVTHLSLSERSREKTMVEIWEFMKRGKGVTQVLLGDLNAEPQSRGIQFLQGKSTLDGIKTDLKDAWLEKHTEPEPRSDDPEDKERRFTFPSDAPSKRIDFVLYRGKGSVHECEIIGQAPTEDTKDYPKDVGMLNARSPIYASDHRGVIAEFTE